MYPTPRSEFLRCWREGFRNVFASQKRAFLHSENRIIKLIENTDKVRTNAGRLLAAPAGYGKQHTYRNGRSSLGFSITQMECHTRNTHFVPTDSRPIF